MSTFDETTGQLARFASSLRFEDLPAPVVHETKRRLVDTLGCALGGADGASAQIARGFAADQAIAPGRPGARVLGLAERVEPAAAAFANGVMTRYLDFNDSFASSAHSGGHPSDMLSALLALGDAHGRSGRDLLLGIAAAYQTSPSVPVHFKHRGWDQGMMTAVGACVGLGAMLGLPEEQVANSISMVVTTGVPLRVSRSGQLSMWKAAATPAASRQAVFATQLALRGMTGPSQPFEGRHGLWDQATGPFELALDPAEHGWRIESVDTKLFPIENGMQPVLPLVLELADGIAVDEIESVDLRTYWGLWFETASEPAKWDPTTRETADHSLPYVLAVALRDRGISLAAFGADAIADPALRPLMQRIRVEEDPELTGPDRSQLGSTVVAITTRSGTRREGRSGVARGHHTNPMSDGELEGKFLGLAGARANEGECRDVLRLLWQLDESGEVSQLADAWASSAGLL